MKLDPGTRTVRILHSDLFRTISAIRAPVGVNDYSGDEILHKLRERLVTDVGVKLHFKATAIDLRLTEKFIYEIN